MASDSGTRPTLDPPDEKTACFVHSLIAGEWVGPANKSKDAPNALQVPQEDALLVDESALDNSDVHAAQAQQRVVQSRQLTKKQLSDMAWNVRKLSKKLDSIKLKLTVKNVFIVTKKGDASVIASTRKVVQWLLSTERDRPYVVYVEKRLENEPEFNVARLMKEEPSAKERLKYWDNDFVAEKAHIFDFVITLGGDGTVLYTSWLFQHVVPPVLSFSLGSLGFLTKHDFGNYQGTLENAFKEGVAVSLRLRFECTIMRSNRRSTGGDDKRDLVEELIGEEAEDTLTHKPDKVIQILNDVVLDRGPNPSMFRDHL